MNNIFKTALLWLPSVLLALIFVSNALHKILDSDQTDKIINNSTVLISTGIFLLLATALFLYNKTIYIGTVLLVLYMTLIIGIHMYKGKPFEVAALIVIATIFAAYIRKPKEFHQKQKL